MNLLKTTMVNGKRLGACTFREVNVLAEWYLYSSAYQLKQGTYFENAAANAPADAEEDSFEARQYWARIIRDAPTRNDDLERIAKQKEKKPDTWRNASKLEQECFAKWAKDNEVLLSLRNALDASTRVQGA